MINQSTLRWVGIYRTSTNLQSEKSIPDQMKSVENYTSSLGMTHAGEDLVQSGISASKRREREDIEGLIERKKNRNDFNAVVVNDYSRLTRRGVKDAFEIERKLNQHGVKVFSATEQIPDGPFSDTMKSILHAQHEQYARNLGMRIAGGQDSSMLMGTSTGTGRVPFGIDRLYISLDGSKKHHIIRVLGDGSQVKLDPTTMQVVEVFEKIAGERPRFYRRQANEKVRLVAGSEKDIELVRRIFKMVVIEGLGYHSVAKTLHQEGIPTPAGGSWAKSSVKRIVTNPIYTGRIVRNRTSNAEYYRRGKGGPEMVCTDVLDYETRKTSKRRPKSDWLIFEADELIGILEPPLRQAAIEYQDRVLSHDIALSESNHDIGRDKHAKSSFILKDVLTLKHDGSPMSGAVVSRLKTDGRIYRYYKPRGFGCIHNEGCVKNFRIPAEPLEAFALDMLMRTIAAAPTLRDEIERHVICQQKLQREAKTHLDELTAKRSGLRRKIATFADLDGDFDDGMAKKVADMRTRLRDLERQIESAQAEVTEDDPSAIADSIVAGLADMGTALSAATPLVIRKMLVAMVERMECDPQERRLWLTLRIPSWAMGKIGNLTLNNVCLGSTSLKRSVPQANYPLATAKMRYLLGHASIKGSLNLANYRLCITGGHLASPTEYIPAYPTPRAVSNAAFKDLDENSRSGLYKLRPRRHKDCVAIIPSDSLPYDWEEFELSYQTLPETWSYWTPTAIAA